MCVGNAGRGRSFAAWSRRLRRVGLCLGAMVIAVASGRPELSAGGMALAATVPGGEIIFVSEGGIQSIQADGSGLRTIVAGGGLPAISPDGQTIAYTDLDPVSGNFDIFLVQHDGSNLRNLTGNSPSSDRAPAWSPDGTRVAFITTAAGNWDVFVVNVDGSGLVNLTNTPTRSEGEPTWSPDGTKIAFDSFHVVSFGDTDVFTVNADGTGLTNVTNRPSNGDFGPEWSLDSSRIAFNTYQGGDQIFLMNADGSDQHHLVDTNIPPANKLAWSPDGSRIAFRKAAPSGLGDIHVVDVDGTNLVNLTAALGANSSFPAWSPDGGRIAFEASFVDPADGFSRPADIYVVNADGTGMAQVTSLPTDDTFPVWRTGSLTAVLSVGTGTANCDDDYVLPISARGIAPTPVSEFGFTLNALEGVLGDPLNPRTTGALHDWSAEMINLGPGLWHATIRSPSPGAAVAIPDGEFFRVDFKPVAEIPQPPDLPLPVPVFIEAGSITGLPALVGQEPGYVVLGVRQTPRMRVGSTSVAPGQQATVPVVMENLCPTSLFGNLLPHEYYDFTVEFDGQALGAAAATLEGTVVSAWDPLADPGSDDLRLQAQIPTSTPLDPSDDLRDGPIAFLRFPTSPTAALGSYRIDLVDANVQAVPTVLVESGTVEIRQNACIPPQDVLWSWEKFVSTVKSNLPATTNRDCVPGHYARFALYRDHNDADAVKLLVTPPLTFEDRGTVQELIDVILPPGADPSCANNEILMTGWVSYADWDPVLDVGGVSAGSKFLFTTRNFPDEYSYGRLGRIEEGTEDMPPTDRTRLVDFFGGDVADKVFSVPGRDVYVPNYPEPVGEFPASSPDGLIPLGFDQINGGLLWSLDAGFGYEYYNDPARRGRQVATASPQGGVRWKEDGGVVILPMDVGIYSAACSGEVAISPRTLGSDQRVLHSQLWGGAHLKGAGELLVHEGELCYVDNRSGHYRPTREHFESFLSSVLRDYEFEPIRQLGDVYFTTPRSLSEACQAALQEHFAVVVSPDPLTLRTGVGQTVTASITLSNQRTTSVDYWIQVIGADWLAHDPSTGRLAPGQSALVNVTATCGSAAGERRARYALLDLHTADPLGSQEPEVVLTCEPLSPPRAPDGLSARPRSDTAIRLGWRDRSGDEDAFLVQRRHGGSWVDEARVPANSTTYEDRGLAPETTYTYRVMALKGELRSAPSATATATTGPARPSGLTASPVGKRHVRLQWLNNSQSATRSILERRTPGSSWSEIGQVPARRTRYTDRNLTPGTTYIYRVFAQGSNARSGPSNEARLAR